MKDKILVIVSVPMLEKEYDIYIPVIKKIGTVKKLIVKVVSEMSDGIFLDDNTKHLYYKTTGEQLDDNEFVLHSNIKSGTKLVLY